MVEANDLKVGDCNGAMVESTSVSYLKVGDEFETRNN